MGRTALLPAGMQACLTIMIIALPGTTVSAVGPGATNGTVGYNGDVYWRADSQNVSGWSTVFLHNDANAPGGTWWTGISLWDAAYKDWGGNDQNGFNRYINEMTIPWIGIKMSGMNIVYYDHNDDAQNGGSMQGHLMFTGNYGFQEAQLVGNPPAPNGPSTLWADYDLDINNDANAEFTFTEKIELFFPQQGLGGVAHMYISVVLPQGQIMMPDGNLHTIDSIEYAYLFDADVYDNANNDIYWWDSNNNLFVQINNEMAFTTSPKPNTGEVGYIDNPNVGRDACMAPLTQNINGIQVTQSYYALVATGNEYSLWPGNYLNNGGTQNADVLFWYVEQYDCSQGNWPPANGVFSEVRFHHFLA